MAALVYGDLNPATVCTRLRFLVSVRRNTVAAQATETRGRSFICGPDLGCHRGNRAGHSDEWESNMPVNSDANICKKLFKMLCVQLGPTIIGWRDQSLSNFVGLIALWTEYSLWFQLLIFPNWEIEQLGLHSAHTVLARCMHASGCNAWYSWWDAPLFSWMGRCKLSKGQKQWLEKRKKPELRVCATCLETWKLKLENLSAVECQNCKNIMTVSVL